MSRYEGCFVLGPGGRCAASSTNCPDLKCREEHRKEETNDENGQLPVEKRVAGSGE
jgi:hypothetical protein